jgi:hypothetical protein
VDHCAAEPPDGEPATHARPFQGEEKGDEEDPAERVPVQLWRGHPVEAGREGAKQEDRESSEMLSLERVADLLHAGSSLENLETVEPDS